MGLLRNIVHVEPAADLTAAKAINFTDIELGSLLLIDTLGLYHYDPAATDTADDNNIIEPTIGGGRLFRITLKTLFANGTDQIEAASIDIGSIDHNQLLSLTVGDAHTQYALLAGRSGGQTFFGGTDANDNVTIESTSNATKGDINIGNGYTQLGNGNSDFAGDISFSTVGRLGIRLNNLTTAQRDALTGVTGFLIYNVDDNEVQVYDGATWVAVGAGGTSLPVATVANTGADYVNIGAALAASETNILVIGDCTETGGHTFSSAVKVNIACLPNVNINYGNNTTYNYSSFDVEVKITGGNHILARTSPLAYWITGTSSNTKTIIENALIDDTASTSSDEIYFINTIGNNIGPCIIKDSTINFSNNASNGFTGNSLKFYNCDLVGGGATCSGIIETFYDSSINNCVFSGTYNPAVSVGTFQRVHISGLTVATSSNITLRATLSSIDNVYQTGFSGISFEIPFGLTYLSDLILPNGEVVLQDGGRANLLNCEIQLNFTELLGFSPCDIKITNSNIQGDITTPSVAPLSNYRIANTDVTGNVLLEGGNIDINQLKVGSLGGGQTFEVSATVTNATISQSRSATALVDNGVNTQQFANQLL